MKKGQVILASLGILAIAGVAVVAMVLDKRSDSEDRFSVSGSGTVYAKADIANISVGLKTEAKKTAAEATAESTRKMDAVINALKALGIEEKDIKTSNYSLQPIYDWLEGRGQVLRGYEVNQNVDVKVRDLAKIGDVIAKTTEQGANQIGGVNFTIDDEFELKNQARELAIQKAKEKASLIAQQAGMELGEVKGVLESSDMPVVNLMYSNARKEMAADTAMNQAAPNIQVGQNEIRAEVTLIYDVK
ncbi:MAG: SIMPL domain-containing protein [Bacillota bacterium]